MKMVLGELLRLPLCEYYLRLEQEEDEDQRVRELNFNSIKVRLKLVLGFTDIKYFTIGYEKTQSSSIRNGELCV